MIRHKWILNLRNTLANLAMECDSAAAIEGSKLTTFERECLQRRLRETIQYIDKQLS